MTYMLDGKQYVVIAAGGDGKLGTAGRTACSHSRRRRPIARQHQSRRTGEPSDGAHGIGESCSPTRGMVSTEIRSPRML